jgi:hypothetical protein
MTIPSTVVIAIAIGIDQIVAEMPAVMSTTSISSVA